MDVNWYVLEMMVDEELRAQRAKAEVAHLAAIARRHPRRLIGIVLIKLGRWSPYPDSPGRAPHAAETSNGA